MYRGRWRERNTSRTLFSPAGSRNSNVDRAAMTSIRLHPRIVVKLSNRRRLRGCNIVRDARDEKSDCSAVDGAESSTRKRGSKSRLATSVDENGKRFGTAWLSCIPRAGVVACLTSHRARAPRPRPFAPHTERAPESRTFALKTKRAKPRAGVRRLNARIPALSGRSTPADAFSPPRLLRWPPQPP